MSSHNSYVSKQNVVMNLKKQQMQAKEHWRVLPIIAVLESLFDSPSLLSEMMFFKPLLEAKGYTLDKIDLNGITAPGCDGRSLPATGGNQILPPLKVDRDDLLRPKRFCCCVCYILNDFLKRRRCAAKFRVEP